jgi:hypothetical protein
MSSKLRPRDPDIDWYSNQFVDMHQIAHELGKSLDTINLRLKIRRRKVSDGQPLGKAEFPEAYVKRRPFQWRANDVRLYKEQLHGLPPCGPVGAFAIDPANLPEGAIVRAQLRHCTRDELCGWLKKRSGQLDQMIAAGTFPAPDEDDTWLMRDVKPYLKGTKGYRRPTLSLLVNGRRVAPNRAAAWFARRKGK